jgi:hypothetical protein
VSVLLATLPYIVAVATYSATAHQLFRGRPQAPPSNWAWLLVAPVAIGGLTPLSLASKANLESSGRALLLSAAALAALFVVLVLNFLRSDRRFWWLERIVSVGNREIRSLRWRHVFVGLGSAILVYGAAVNIIVSSKS